jgi:hypothetical protein
MSKERLLKQYVKWSVLVGLYIILAEYLYQVLFTKEWNVEVQHGLFILHFDNFFDSKTMFNTPLVSFLMLFVLNVVVLIITKGTKTEHKQLLEAPYLNTAFLFLLIVGQIAFTWMIPSRVNGVVRDMVFFTEFPLRMGEMAYAVNIMYLVGFLYVVYNLIIWSKIAEPKKINTVDEHEMEEEEKILRELLKD